LECFFEKSLILAVLAVVYRKIEAFATAFSLGIAIAEWLYFDFKTKKTIK